MATARTPIDFYFDFLSSYGYFASLRIEALAARHGRTVRWHSMLLGVAVMKTMGLKPLLDTPLKSDYVLRDAARYMRRHRLQLARKLTDPAMDPLAAARGFYWVRRHRPGQEAAYARVAFDRYWREGRDLSTPAQVAALAPAIGIDPAAMLAGIEDDQARGDLREAVAASLARGVFGSPFIFVDGEPFWGSDRLEQIDEWLSTGGW
jgi:2-hydroxychromene-2-carboxylate isomerase